ncbi:beta-ketoacyl synthase N-terminal-like domain-containing protein [Glycomyces tritici]|uniref:Beta-ketoacyl synthase N-terminal-like domain-containing protein n=1 Tax=Glycomyces tritici TaxID=2665176 RepID=A0ABT7YYT6_9ACTN|nr:beta-ketoacyl synthase N-terminal-like domain-containing protein [Glycomyces tritici]MDN3243805.1 beta-ketoacyl synthase N-terminal-like domain-containing protein [Glycomyces tritici]
MNAPYRLAVTGIGRALPAPGESAEGWFDHRTRLGRRGYKYLPRASQYLLAAGRDALADAGIEPSGPVEDIGAVIGTSHGVTALHTQMDAVIRTEGAVALSPATAAYFSVNLIPSRLAAEHGLRAFNVPVTSAGTAGLESLLVGANAIRYGRAKHLLAGATEHPASGSPKRRGDDGAVVLVSGADDGSDCHGTVAVEAGFLSPLAAGDPVERARAWFDRAAARLQMDEGTPLTFIADDSAVAAAFGKAVDARTVESVPGSLQATMAIADALQDGPPSSAVLVACAGGNTALARIERKGNRHAGTD